MSIEPIFQVETKQPPQRVSVSSVLLSADRILLELLQLLELLELLGI
jgi:hypothetical protein